LIQLRAIGTLKQDSSSVFDDAEISSSALMPPENILIIVCRQSQHEPLAPGLPSRYQ
jgi:hypothetical protein